MAGLLGLDPNYDLARLFNAQRMGGNDDFGLLRPPAPTDVDVTGSTGPAPAVPMSIGPSAARPAAPKADEEESDDDAGAGKPVGVLPPARPTDGSVPMRASEPPKADPTAPAGTSPAAGGSFFDGFGSKLMGGLKDNSDLLIGIGAGLLSKRGIGAGLGEGLKLGTEMQSRSATTDLARQKAESAKASLTGNALMVRRIYAQAGKDISDQEALGIASNSGAFSSLLASQNKPAQLVDTTDAEGRTVKQWIVPGQSSGISVGSPKETPDGYHFTQTPDGATLAINKSDPTKVIVSMGGEKFRPPSDEERERWSLTKGVPYKVGPKGPEQIGGQKTEVNIDQKGESEFEKEFGKKSADRFNNYILAADKAQGTLSDIGQLREISRRVGSTGSVAGIKEWLGPHAEALGLDIKDLSDIQAFSSVIQRLAPALHVPGTGATSDIEFKGFLKSLPQLASNPAAREMIMDTMEAFARRQSAQGDIAVKVQTKELSRTDAEKQLRELGDPLANFRKFKADNPTLLGGAPGPAIAAGPVPATGAPAASAPPAPAPAAAAPPTKVLRFNPKTGTFE